MGKRKDNNLRFDPKTHTYVRINHQGQSCYRSSSPKIKQKSFRDRRMETRNRYLQNFHENMMREEVEHGLKEVENMKICEQEKELEKENSIVPSSDQKQSSDLLVTIPQNKSDALVYISPKRYDDEPFISLADIKYYRKPTYAETVKLGKKKSLDLKNKSPQKIKPVCQLSSVRQESNSPENSPEKFEVLGQTEEKRLRENSDSSKTDDVLKLEYSSASWNEIMEEDVLVVEKTNEVSIVEKSETQKPKSSETTEKILQFLQKHNQNTSQTFIKETPQQPERLSKRKKWQLRKQKQNLEAQTISDSLKVEEFQPTRRDDSPATSTPVKCPDVPHIIVETTSETIPETTKDERNDDEKTKSQRRNERRRLRKKERIASQKSSQISKATINELSEETDKNEVENRI